MTRPARVALVCWWFGLGIGLGACSDPDEAVVPDVPDTTVWPDIIAPDVPTDTHDDTPETVPDVAEDTEDDAADTVEDSWVDTNVPVEEFPTGELISWTPAFIDQVLVTVDGDQITAGLLGGVVKVLDTWGDSMTAGSPIGIPSGLMCWDIDGDGKFNADKEDYDGDGKASEADCVFHPAGAPDGYPGVAVAVNGGGACEIRAYTLTGYPVWTTKFDGVCRQPGASDEGLLVPLALGDVGEVQYVRSRNGTLGSKVSLPKPPTTNVARIGDSWAVGSGAGVTVIELGFGATPALLQQGTVDVLPDRPTSVFAAGDGVVGATLWRQGDAATGLGRRLVRISLTGDAGAAVIGGVLSVPGDIWSIPAAGVLDEVETIVAGGFGWVRAFASTGANDPLWSGDVELGTVTSLALGGDGRVYVGQTEWNGDPTVNARWRLERFAPKYPDLTEIVAESDGQVAVRGVSAPVLLCETAVLQTIGLDGKADVSAVKACPKALAPAGWSRAFGGNNNRGAVAIDGSCWGGAGVTPCEALEGCTNNLECDDESVCTLDSCVEGECSYKLLPGCCIDDKDCDDTDLCTIDSCLPDGKCQHKQSPLCCESSSECDDGSPCTLNHCESGFCKYIPDTTLDGCCNSADDCEDQGDACQEPSCDATAQCGLAQIEGCCLADWYCDDLQPCTENLCVANVCVYPETPDEEGCCTTDEDCDDGDICTTQYCSDLSECIVEVDETCCIKDEDCDDELPCSVDTCTESNKCTNELTPSLEGCCETDEECQPEVLDPCLTYKCDTEVAECIEEPMDCDDGIECTDDVCENGECFHKFDETLCDDEKPCTLDSCAEDGSCINEQDGTLPGCCESALECDDDLPCTLDVCELNYGCAHEPIDKCCMTDEDCDDFQVATTDKCIENVCVYSTCDKVQFEALKKPYDIVFVVDQSTSMELLIPKVRDYLNDFAAFIAAEDVDYHVILVATRYDGENKICIEPPLAGANCTDTDVFRQIDEQVGSHDALEKIMDNFAEIEDFMRAGSTRHFVAISDDYSEVSAASFSFFLNSLPDDAYADYAFHSIVGLNTMTCSTGKGTDYITLSGWTGGLVVDICGDDWTDSFTKLGAAAGQAAVSFPLDMTPVEDTVTVTYKGQPLTQDVQWEYNGAVNRVVLLEPYPIPGGALEICYTIL